MTLRDAEKDLTLFQKSRAGYRSLRAWETLIPSGRFAGMGKLSVSLVQARKLLNNVALARFLDSPCQLPCSSQSSDESDKVHATFEDSQQRGQKFALFECRTCSFVGHTAANRTWACGPV